MMPTQKETICENIEKGMMRSFVQSYLRISKSRIDKMMVTFRRGGVFHDDNVRLHKLDQKSYNDLPELVAKKAKEQRNPVKRSQLINIIQEEVVQSNLRRGGNGLTAKIKDIRTVETIIKDTKALRSVKGQTTTLARQRESLDLRNFFVTHVMNSCYAEGKDPHLIGNFDATQYHLTFTNEEELIEIVQTIDTSKNDVPLSEVEESVLDIFIKYICMANAVGKLAIPVFILADPSMDAEEGF